MWIDIAKTIVGVFGPCQIVQWRARDPALLYELLLAGCDSYAVGEARIPHARWISPDSETGVPRFPVAAVEVSHGGDTVPLLQALLKRADLHGLALITQGHNKLRQPLDQIIFDAGWRRHPGGLADGDYESLSDTSLPRLALYQRIPARAAAERIPRGDMLRESGARADAHIARYALAASLVRPGDSVLDYGCGFGYGCSIVATQSRAAKIIGADVDTGAVAYAEANYSGPGVSFQTADPAALAAIPDASIDLIVAMELEHAARWRQIAKQFARILKPDGRLIASVRDRWMTERHDDHHEPEHPFDWKQLRNGLADHFIIERRYIQVAPGGVKLISAARRLQTVPLTSDSDAEWIVVVASSNPLMRATRLRDDFKHPAFSAALAASHAPVVDILRGYDNPWLYRTLVQMGERIGDDDALQRLAEWVSDNARIGSADQGAALCVAGYRALERRDIAAAVTLTARINAYQRHIGGVEKVSTNPHLQRWRVSSAYLAGRLCELSGAPDDALTWFTFATQLDWQSFSPLLATKTIAAAVHAARLCLARGAETDAIAFFQLGLNTALRAAAGNPTDIVGNVAAPIAFGLTELAEVMDMGSQCAVALANLPLCQRSPALFWRQVDMKRFGLATWTKDVEAENARLRNQMSPTTLRIAS